MSCLALDELAFDFCLHPSLDLVVAGLISGYVHCYRYNLRNNEHELVWSHKAFKKACRGIEFNHDGSSIVTVSRSRCIQILDAGTGRPTLKILKAHPYAINKVTMAGPMTIATGDDEGMVKLWDLRTNKAVQRCCVHDDFIADMIYHSDQMTLLVAGGDGRLSAHDTRRDRSPLAVSRALDDELLSLAVVENGNKVVAGAQSGALHLWQWGEWTSPVRRWLGHPSSIDTMCRLGQDSQTSVCTGSSDGLLRRISLSSSQVSFDGILGDHGEDLPIERVRTKSQLLASCGHDLRIRFWDLSGQ